MSTPSKSSVIVTMRSLLVIAGAVIMLLALSPLTIDATAAAPEQERERDIEERGEEKHASGKKAGSFLAGGGKGQRSPARTVRISSRQAVAEKVLTAEAAPGLRTTGRAASPAPAVVSDYRRALEAFLTLVGTLLPGPSGARRARPHSRPLPERTGFGNEGSLPPGITPAAAPYTERSPHSPQKVPRAVKNIAARSTVPLDVEMLSGYQIRTAMLVRPPAGASGRRGMPSGIIYA